MLDANPSDKHMDYFSLGFGSRPISFGGGMSDVKTFLKKFNDPFHPFPQFECHL